MKKYIIPIVVLMFMFSSCMVNRHTVGDGPVGKKGHHQLHAKAKQPYLFWGLISLGNSSPNTPSSGDYQIKTSYNFWDGLVSSLTSGIFSMRTIKIFVKPETSAEVPVSDVNIAELPGE